MNAYTGRDDLRAAKVRCDGFGRADIGLRTFALREGDAVFCRRCDGQGYVPSINRLDPLKCSRCNGEGLEPVNEA